MDKKKILQELVTQKVNESGEVTEQLKTTSFLVEKEPDYIKLYIKDVLRLTDIPNSSNAILFSVLKRMTYDSEIALFAPVKKRIAAELNLSEPTVSKAIELFAKKSILLRKDRGLYVVNPFFFGRGKWEEIRQIRFQILYSESGRMILKSEIEEKDSMKDTQDFESKKRVVIDDEKHLAFLQKKSELTRSLEIVNNEILGNTKDFKNVA